MRIRHRRFNTRLHNLTQPLIRPATEINQRLGPHHQRVVPRPRSILQPKWILSLSREFFPPLRRPRWSNLARYFEGSAREAEEDVAEEVVRAYYDGGEGVCGV
jgi:hypothetical protein